MHLLLFCSPCVLPVRKPQEGLEIKCSSPLPLHLCVCWLQIQPRLWILVSQSDVAASSAQLALLLLPPPDPRHPSIHLKSHPRVNVAVDSLQILPVIYCSFQSPVLNVDILLKDPSGRGVHNIFTSLYFLLGGDQGGPWSANHTNSH